MKKIFAAALLLFFSKVQCFSAEPNIPAIPGAPANLFLQAIEKGKPEGRYSSIPVTGLTVPHHLIAADLIARALWTASNNTYDRIVVISPDHFRRSHKPVATTKRTFETVFGEVHPDKEAAEILIATKLVDDSDLFEHEHGVTGILPLLRHFFPSVPVLPIAIHVYSSKSDWQQIVEILRPVITPHTLIIQSTDFSHYLLPDIARARDQETLNVISSEDPDSIEKLQQPNHLDSKASQYVQMRIQNDFFNAHGAVIANRNSFEYQGRNVASTSYIVTVYSTDELALSALSYADSSKVYFAGDVFLGRYLTPLIIKEEARQLIIKRILSYTAGGPLIINLEGVMLDRPPTNSPPSKHLMDAALAGPILKSINVKAASLANNHSFDLGRDGLVGTSHALQARGIKGLRHNEIADFGDFRVLTLNFVGAEDFKGYPVVPRINTKGSYKYTLDKVCERNAPAPIVAFVHMGREYESTPNFDDQKVADQLAECGIVALIAAHSHRASHRLQVSSNGELVAVYSLGNFIFDQLDGTGSIIELRVFKQGTVALRLIRIENLFHVMQSENQ